MTIQEISSPQYCLKAVKSLSLAEMDAIRSRNGMFEGLLKANAYNFSI